MGRLFSCVALLLTLMMSFGPVVERASAQTDDAITGNSYTDATYGFTVTWPKNSYVATPILDDSDDPYGVYLDTDTSLGSIAAGGYDTTADCVADRIDRLSQIDGVSRVRKTAAVDLPEFDRDTDVAVVKYTYDNPDTGDSGDFITYYGCEVLLQNGEPVDGVVLTHDFGESPDRFEDEISDWVDVVNDVTFGDDNGSGNDNSTNDNSNPDQSNNSNTTGSADGLSDTSYVDPTYHFGVKFANATNSDLLTDDTGNQIGVGFESDTYSGSAQVFAGSTLRACVNSVLDTLDSADADGSADPVTDLDPPESPDAGRSTLVLIDGTDSSGNEANVIAYVECREMVVDGEPADDTFLAIWLLANEDDYADAIPDYEDILASITFDVESDGNATSNDNGGSSSDGVNGTTYIDPTYGFTVEFPTATETDPTTDDNGNQIGMSFKNDIWAAAAVSYNGASARACVNDYSDHMDTLDTDGAAERADNVDAPDSPDAERSVLLTVDIGDAGDSRPLIAYIECRPMIQDGQEVDGVYLSFWYLVGKIDYDDALPELQDLIDSIAFDAQADSRNTDNSDDTNDDNGNTSQAGGIDGDTYSSSVGYQLTWDDSLFSADLVDSKAPDSGVVLSSDSAIVTVQTFGDPTIDDCVSNELDVVQGSDGMGRLTRVRDADPLEGTDDGQSTFVGGDLTLTSGDNLPVYVYIECRPTSIEASGNPVNLAIRVVAAQDAWADATPALQDILDSVQIDS